MVEFVFVFNQNQVCCCVFCLWSSLLVCLIKIKFVVACFLLVSRIRIFDILICLDANEGNFTNVVVVVVVVVVIVVVVVVIVVVVVVVVVVFVVVVVVVFVIAAAAAAAVVVVVVVVVIVVVIV